jgi:maltose O-acetyltransferase
MTEDLVELVRGGDVEAPMCDEFRKMILGSKLVSLFLMSRYEALNSIKISFAARNSESMPNYKLNVRRKLLKFNDESIGDDDTLDSLKERRMAAAKSLFGRVGGGTNIEAPFFCTWGCTTFIGKDVYINRE